MAENDLCSLQIVTNVKLYENPYINHTRESRLFEASINVMIKKMVPVIFYGYSSEVRDDPRLLSIFDPESHPIEIL